MTSDYRITSDFIPDVLNALERHGYVRSDWLSVPSSRPTAPQQPGPPAVIVLADQVKILLAAADDAGYKGDRAETCADCAGHSCTTCQWRLRAAGAYDRMVGQMIQAAEASAARPQVPGHAAPPSAGHRVVAGQEAGQSPGRHEATRRKRAPDRA
jgi:ferredoxin